MAKGALRICESDDCQNEVSRRGMCARHYRRFLRDGGERVRRQISQSDVCSWGDCSEPVRSLGLCRIHYIRNRRGFPMDEPLPRRYSESDCCEVPGCSRSPMALGFCQMHYARMRVRGDVGGAEPEVTLDGEHCSHPGCGERYYARGLCSRHYNTARTRERKCKLPRELIEQRMQYYGWKCWICGGPFEQVDHVKPIAAGGAVDLLANLRPSCRSCNASKNATWPFCVEDFRRMRMCLVELSAR